MIVSSNQINNQITVSSYNGKAVLKKSAISNVAEINIGQLPSVTVTDPALKTRVIVLEEWRSNGIIDGGIIF